MSGRGGRPGPAFSGRTGRGGGRISSLQARDAVPGGSGGGRGTWDRGRGGGKWKRPLNANFMSGKEGGGGPANTDEVNAKLAQAQAEDALEAVLGFPLFTSGNDKLGWLMNMQPSCMEDKESGHVASAVDLYLMCQDGSMFKARMPFAPYFYVQVTPGGEVEVETGLRKRFDGLIREVEVVEREDLDLKNHLSGLRRKLIKLSFWNVQQLMEVRREVTPAVARNKARARTTQAYTDVALVPAPGGMDVAGTSGAKDVMDCLMDMREYDVPYHVRFAIDLDIRCGHWFNVSCKEGVTMLTRRPHLLQRAEPRICAWDIETTKLPLQFPNPEYDQVFMISYMLDRQGYLITNREVVGADISDFEFTPKPEFEGPFIIHNEPNERALLTRFFTHMREVKPAVYVTYNGDFFDFPFVAKRATVHGMDLYDQLGFRVHSSGEVLARHAVHMDCLHWVNRDSYLPQGSRGLKAVTKAKLGYDPVEVAPEDMLRMAAEQPQDMGAYSVSDAVSTYYLYMTYIHPFIFSLATIIPLPPDEVLRKGSGTLCEQLLMVQAFQKGIVCPNKHVAAAETFYKGHLLESETYIGGKVEAIESGVFRSDLPLKWRCSPEAYQGLLDRLDRDLAYAVVHEGKMKVEDLENYADVREQIAAKLTALRDTPNREECPLIYHLDVAAMYPNIILTNRLQPSAIVTDEDCAACDFNGPDKTCLRNMEWMWRGEHFAASRNEYLAIKNQLQAETFPPAAAVAGGAGRAGWGTGAGGRKGPPLPPGQPRSWDDLGQEERDKLLKERLKKYTQKVYKRVLEKPVTELRVAGVCQRENSFYVDTVRAFRDRRYEYKGLNKVWKGKLDAAKAEGAPLRAAEAADMVVLYDSLQLAHKCILNSFYGYVMRKGARWYSMEMAGVVTYTGAHIIQRANALVGALGRPLELDTDGIWCALPASFPENFKLKNKNGKELRISYPCVMLNVMVADHNTNPQYATLVDPATRTYATSPEMSIEFEVDGPYKAMILPASKEEGKSIKKRYAVFNFDGSLAELKGFEVKRRGELKLIKVFQAEVFSRFLEGGSLPQCYAAVGAVANRWLDMLDTQGTDLTDEELIEHISEATTMSKGLDEYEGRKSSAITCARRLGAFLGDERIKDKGLNCQYVIARKPEGQPTSERAIPVSIFSAEPAVARAYLRQWCGDVGSAGPQQVPNVRDIVDWGYYRERLGSAIQKIITIPAAMQGVPNPVPRVKHPDWLARRVAALSSRSHQRTLKDLLPSLGAKPAPAAGGDIEDLGAAPVPRRAPTAAPEPLAPAVRACEADDAPIAVADQAGEGAGGAGGVDRENVDPNVELPGSAAFDGPATAKRPRPKPAYASDTYKDWVAFQKTQWRQAREQRKRRRVEAAAAAKAGPRSGIPASGPGPEDAPGRADVARILRRQAAAITAVPWQLLQVAETGKPGLFKVWFLASGQVHSISLRVQRVFYVDSEQPLDMEVVTAAAVGAAAGAGLPHALTHTPGGATVPGSQLAGVLAGLRDAACVRVATKVLPGGRSAKHLYQVTMPEEQHLAHSALLSAVLSASYVRAVYEERLPLMTAVVMALGSTAQLKPAAASKPLGAEFTLDDFQEAAPADRAAYLAAPPAVRTVRLLGSVPRQAVTAEADASGAGEKSDPLGPQLRHIVLVGSGDVAAGRALYALFVPSSGQCLVVVVQATATAGREVSVSGLERGWREACTNTQGPGAAPPRVQFSLEFCKDSLEAGRQLQRALAAARTGQRGRGLCIVQAPQSSTLLTRTWLPALADCPCLDLQPNADDSRYPALQWQARATRRALHRLLEAGAALADRAALARYAAIPIANIGADTIVSVADVLFARSLRAADHVLWMTDPAAPDLGVEGKDCAEELLGGVGAVVSEPPGANGQTAGGTGPGAGSTPELLAPGAYRSMCCQLKLYHLAVAALLEAATLGDLEGAASVEGAGGLAGPAFKVLRGLVSSWLHDATSNSNAIADLLLRSLYRWTSSPGAALYDGTLHAALQGVMAKLFAQLVSEMRKLGATLVHANFHTLIVATGKREPTAAAGYVNYLIEALRRRDLFGWLQLSPQVWWHSLLFRDPYNWGGITAPDPTAGGPKVGETSQSLLTQAPGGDDADVAYVGERGGIASVHEGGGDASGSAGSEAALSYQWALAAFLPPVLQEELELLLNQFVYLPWKEAQKVATTGAGPGSGDGTAQGAAEIQDVQARFLAAALPTTMTQQLLQVVGEAVRTVRADSEQPEHQFPARAGSHLTPEELGSPALAFVRAACHVLALDSGCVDAVAVLRRQLLRLLHVREFSEAASFKEMCLALTVPDVICSYCNDCRDLDLCRDAELAAQGAAGAGWQCRVCAHPYDMRAMERRLITALGRHVREYQLQDQQCSRCRAVQAHHVGAACARCGADFVATLPLATMRKRLTVFRSVAAHHGFEVLREQADALLLQPWGPET